MVDGFTQNLWLVDKFYNGILDTITLDQVIEGDVGGLDFDPVSGGLYMVNGFVGASFAMIILTAAIRSIPLQPLLCSQRGRRWRLRSPETHHPAVASLANHLRDHLAGVISVYRF